MYKQSSLGTASTLRPRTVLDLIGLSTISEQSWTSNASSAFTFKDQTLYDKVLYNNLDIVSSNKNLTKIKNYEYEFNMPSNVFFTKWYTGELPSSPKTHDWATLYKRINKWQEEKQK
ncbi:MAG: hypothetical protein RI947_1454 [Candidatus Parcubacteria bacterium]